MIALLPLVAMLGAEVGKRGVHHPRHLFAIDHLPGNHTIGSVGLHDIDRINGWHLQLRRRQPGACVRRDRQLRHQHDADQYAADCPQQATGHDRAPRSVNRGSAQARAAHAEHNMLTEVEFMNVDARQAAEQGRSLIVERCITMPQKNLRKSSPA